MVHPVSRDSLRHLLFALVLAATAVWLRGTLIMTTEVIDPLRADAFEYYRYAMNLEQCGVYSRSLESITSGCTTPARSDSVRPPGYPIVLMPFVEWPPTAATLLRIQWFQVLLSASTVMLIYFALLPLGVVTAAAAAILSVLSPHLAAMNLYVLSETVFTFMLVVFVFAAARWSTRPSLAHALTIGAALGLATLVRPTTLYLIVCIVPLFAWLARERRAGTAAAVLAGFLICYGPWYTLSKFHLPAPQEQSLALTSLHSGTYPDLMVDGRPETRGAPHFYDASYAERDSLAKVLAHLIERARAEPYTYLRWYAVGKAATYLSWDIIAGAGDVFVYPVKVPGFATHHWLGLTHWSMWPLHDPLTILALIAAVLAWLPPRRMLERPASELILTRLLALVFIYFILIHVVGTPLPRYSIPIRPILYGLACWIIVLPLRAAWRRVRTR